MDRIYNIKREFTRMDMCDDCAEYGTDLCPDKLCKGENMGLFSWGGKPIEIETLEQTHKKLDREIAVLEKMRQVDRKISTWKELKEKKKHKLVIKDELERLMREDSEDSKRQNQ
jgi:uncharacterized protein YdcH (DUF465 family)